MTGHAPGGARRPRVLLGVAGGIAAYKAALLLRLFTESGHEVQVVPTAAALRFVGEPTWAALSGRPVATEVWDDVHTVPHVRLAREADLVIVAPATADLLARAAHGLADDLLTNVLLTARCPVMLAPAMHTEMWEHPATRANVATLRERGVVVVDPDSGRLTGADTGPGRLPEPETLFAAALRVLDGAGAVADAASRPEAPAGDLTGVRVVISAGGTREPVDPVRFLGNASSGLQGYALAAVARARGAAVDLVAANTALPDPEGVRVHRVATAADLHAAMLDLAPAAGVLVMAAAVADFRPVSAAQHKIKKSDDPADAPVIRLERTVDVLADLVAARGAGRWPAPGPLVVGFAAETGDEHASVLDHARAKLARKGCDLLVVNDVSGGKVFGRPHNEVVVLSADGGEVAVPPGSKTEVAEAIWNVVVTRLAARPQT